MLQYEFKERKINKGKLIYDKNDVKLVEYKTGYEEFMLRRLTIRNICSD
jgi:hypothetical protein